MNLFFPDYSNSILNLSASLMKRFGLSTQHPTLADIDQLLAQDYKNIILLTLDGMGSEFLKQQLKTKSFLRTHYKRDLSSVYPCTTTAATTSMQSGLSPAEHGWLGWNAWFMEYAAIVDLFLDRNSLSGETITPSPAGHFLKYKSIVERIKDIPTSEYKCHTVMPPFAEGGVSSFEQMAEQIILSCNNAGRRFIWAYWYEPDTLMHKYGPESSQVEEEISNIDQIISDVFRNLSDVLLIITADHGQIGIDEELFIDDRPDFLNCLLIPPSIENRAASLFVKPNYREEFLNMFEDLLGSDHLLLSREQVFEMNLFGPGIYHPKVDAFVGDYLACATGTRMLRYIGAHDRERYYFKGHHAGLTTTEMLVPLIIATR